jgi:hypothetical protein
MTLFSGTVLAELCSRLETMLSNFLVLSSGANGLLVNLFDFGGSFNVLYLMFRIAVFKILSYIVLSLNCCSVSVNDSMEMIRFCNLDYWAWSK